MRISQAEQWHVVSQVMKHLAESQWFLLLFGLHFEEHSFFQNTEKHENPNQNIQFETEELSNVVVCICVSDIAC